MANWIWNLDQSNTIVPLDECKSILFIKWNWDCMIRFRFSLSLFLCIAMHFRETSNYLIHFLFNRIRSIEILSMSIIVHLPCTHSYLTTMSNERRWKQWRLFNSFHCCLQFSFFFKFIQNPGYSMEWNAREWIGLKQNTSFIWITILIRSKEKKKKKKKIIN